MNSRKGTDLAVSQAAADVVKLYAEEADEEYIRRRCKESSDYESAFNGFNQIIDKVQVLSDDAELLEILDEDALERNWKSKMANRKSLMSLAASVVFFVGLIFVALNEYERTPSHGKVDRYITRIGELKEFVLPDGSVMFLNSATKVFAEFDDMGRKVVFDRGEAFFDVRPDENRPFTIDLGRETITVLGTSFNLRMTSDGFVVGVKEGSIALHEKGGENFDKLKRLSPSETGTLIHDARVPLRVESGLLVKFNSRSHDFLVTRDNDGFGMGEWKSGILVFSDVSLSEVVKELNRYTVKKILIEDSSIMEMKVFATVRTDNVGMALVGFEKMLPIKVSTYFDRIVVVGDSNR
ncbi:FecR domain-containing protein [Porticoccaceae bacterium LTM1]|nr:FecR domain-containing protein [Porticoccaceae bacterium LTM1]